MKVVIDIVGVEGAIPSRKSRFAPQALLDAATFEALWAEGQAMTLEQAIAYALEESEIDSASSIATAAPQ